MKVHDSIRVHAPIERLWALSTRVELVQATLGMELTGDLRSGPIEEGSRVLWKGWKFGLPTRHTTLITGFQPPKGAADHSSGMRRAWFQDSQERGRFQTFHHDHWMTELAGADGSPETTLRDEVNFTLGAAYGGEPAALLLVGPYVRKLVRQRFALLKRLAEGDEWRRWLQ